MAGISVYDGAAPSPESTPCASPGGPPHWPSPVAARTPAVAEIAMSVDTLQIRLQTQAAALAERLKALEGSPQDAKPTPVHAKVKEVEAMHDEVQALAKKLHARIEALEEKNAEASKTLEATARIESQARLVEDKVKQLESLHPAPDAEVTNKIADVEARQAQLLQRIFELEGSGTNGSGLTPAYLEDQLQSARQREEEVASRQAELERALRRAEEEAAQAKTQAISAEASLQKVLASRATNEVTSPTLAALEAQLLAHQQSKDSLEAQIGLVEAHVHNLVLKCEGQQPPKDGRPEHFISASAAQRLPNAVLMNIKEATVALDRNAVTAMEPRPAMPQRPAVPAQLPARMQSEIKAATACLDEQAMRAASASSSSAWPPDAATEVFWPPAAPSVFAKTSPQVEEQDAQIQALQANLKAAEALVARLQNVEGMLKETQASLSKETARCKVFEDENSVLAKQVEEQRAQLQDSQFLLAEAAGEHTALKSVMAERDQYIAFTKQNEIELGNLKQQFEKEFVKLRREAAEQGRLLAEEQILLKQSEGRVSSAAKAEKAALAKISALERELNELQEKVAVEGATSRRMSDSIQQSATVQEELRQTLAMAESDRKAAIEAREAQLRAAAEEQKHLKDELRETQAKLHQEIEAKESQLRDEQRARESLTQQCDRLLQRMREQDEEMARLRADQDRAQPPVAVAPIVVQDTDPLIQAENVVLKKQLASSWGHVAKIQSQLDNDREMWMKELDAAEYRAAAATAAMRQPLSPEPRAQSPQVELEESYAVSFVEGPIMPRPVRVSRPAVPIVVHSSPSPSAAAPVAQLSSSTSSFRQSLSFQPRVVAPSMTVSTSPQATPGISRAGSVTSPVPSATFLVHSESASNCLQPRVVQPSLETVRVVQAGVEPARLVQPSLEPRVVQPQLEAARFLPTRVLQPEPAAALLQYMP